ncbi:CDP-alcohol phosphatidyltransferase family protein [Arthrobacter sp. NPDC058130]|uniref:CDP-alcohol phosphatidyltransferase family protein n=1 Tax=Arthrobacter sp. NPDC058130 TaxID=3346353 RepID=UPI0036E3793F
MGPAPARARRAVADAGAAAAAYLVAWAWLGMEVLADPVLWFWALAAGAAVILRATGCVLSRNPKFSTPGDRVTLGRAVIVACCAAMTVVGLIAGTEAGAKAVVVLLGTTAFLLDAVDGRVARFTGSATAEGSRLDSDTDAALVLVLSCAAAGTFGPWPLGIGLMYYAFLAAACFRPSLKTPLRSSTVRKLIGAAQPAALLFALLPGVPQWLGIVVLGAALGLLAYSFGRDAVELERLRRANPGVVSGSPAPCAGTPAGR